MIYGIGCDLCDTARMAKSLGGPHGSTFAARVFGPAEGGSAKWIDERHLRAKLSLSHDGGMALAFCILETET